MSDSSSSHNPLILADFLAHLRNANFDIGVDDYLRLQQLLNHPGFRCQPEELKTILCPIFATSEKQQQRFYEIFDLFFAGSFGFAHKEVAERRRQATKPLQPLPVSTKLSRRFVYSIGTLPVVLGISFAVWLWWPRTEPLPPEPPIITLPTLPSSPAPQATTTIQPIGAPIPASWQVISREPIPRSETREVPQPNIWRDNWHWLVLTISVLPLLAILALWFKRKLNQRWLRDKHRDKQPPFTWPLSVPKTTQRLHAVEPFNATTRLLRRRQRGEAVGLDVEATISATIVRFGFPVLRFRPTSKVPEYLLLIDRVTLADHQAHFFNELAVQFANEDVFVERYFFDGDPRICYRDDYLTGVPLTDLPRNNQRLLVYGDGTGLLDNATGALADWSEWLADWDDRALLTVTPPVQWGARERKLSDLLLVSPATLEGLREAITHCELQTSSDLRAIRRRSAEPELPNFAYDETPAVTAEKLRAYLGDETLFQWVCACAVYPELQWDLTLCLGEQVMPDGQLWEKDILRLARLPWFRQGVLPDELRYELLRRLTPENQQKVSVKLTEVLQLTEAELLQKFPKFENSWARESLGLQVDLQQWLAHRDDERARLLRERLREMPPSLVTRDYTALREVEAEPLTPFQQKLKQWLPAEWRSHLYLYGMPLSGIKNSVWLTLAATLALLVTVALTPFQPSAQTRIEIFPLSPIEENITAVIPSIAPTPNAPPTSGATPVPSVLYGGLRVTAEPGSKEPIQIRLQDTQSGNVFTRGMEGFGYLQWNDLPVGLYRLSLYVRSSSNCNNLGVQVYSGRITEVKCQMTDTDSFAVCFEPVAQIIAERTVRAGESVLLNGRVSGGQNYGKPVFNWSPSAGKVVTAGSSPAFGPLYRLDTTGVAPGTTITIRLQVTSSQGNCEATATEQIRVASAPTSIPPVTSEPLLMPNVIGQDLATARAVLQKLEPKLQIATDYVPGQQGRIELIIRQMPEPGQPLRPGQRVTLYVPQFPTPAVSTPTPTPNNPQTCYNIRLDDVITIEDGEAGAPRWAFDILVEGRRLFALPAKSYSDRKAPSGPPRRSFVQQSSAVPSTGSGVWCGAASLPSFRLEVIGTNLGEKDPQQRTARGEQAVQSSPKGNTLALPVKTSNPKDGSFTFRFTITPVRAPAPAAR